MENEKQSKKLAYCTYLSAADGSKAIYLMRHFELTPNPEFHEAMEFVFLLSGEVEGLIGGKSRILTSGQAFLSNSFEEHYYRQISPQLDAIVLVVASEYTKTFAYSYPGVCLPAFLDDAQKNEAPIALVMEWLQNTKRSYLVDVGYTCLLLGLLVDRYPLNKIEADSRKSISIRAIRYVNEHYGENISLESCAKTLGYATEYLSRTLYKCTGFRFRDYLNSVRYRSVQAMLERSGGTLSRSEAILNSGFNSSATYYRVQKTMEKEKRDKEITS